MVMNIRLITLYGIITEPLSAATIRAQGLIRAVIITTVDKRLPENKLHLSPMVYVSWMYITNSLYKVTHSINHKMRMYVVYHRIYNIHRTYAVKF